jgi:ATP-binding cassette subfamily B protein
VTTDAIPTWPWSRAAEALTALAGTAVPSDPPRATDHEGRERWLEAAIARLGNDADAEDLSCRGSEQALRGAGPALLSVEDGAAPALVAIQRGRRGALVLLDPDGRARRTTPRALATALRRPLEGPHRATVDSLLDASAVPARNRDRARDALLAERLADAPLGTLVHLRPSPAMSFRRLLRRAGVLRALAAFVAAHAVQYILWLASWWVIGHAALEDSVDGDVLLLWAALLTAVAPARLVATALQGRIAVDAGRALRRRLLHGALRLEPEEMRTEGAGRLLARVLESEAIETLAVTGGLAGIVALVEVGLAVPVLAAGATPVAHLLALAAWLTLTAALARRYIERRRAWTAARLDLTYELVERMVGHRTRLAQQRPEDWHAGEREALEDYHSRAQAMDRSLVALAALVPRGWMLAALLTLTPALLHGELATDELAVSLGGILVAHRAFSLLVEATSHLAGAAIAWSQVASLFDAAARPQSPHPPDAAAAGHTAGTLLTARRLRFTHATRPAPVLDGCDLDVARGERLLLEGTSGSGKSTLVSLLAGLRQSQDGTLLLAGRSPHDVGGRAWRRRVMAAPQFHENHILLGSLAFNVLLARRWPPRLGDLADAERTCRRLGLGALIDKMPSGIEQIIGETGWQLSHGQRSLVYIARARLADPDLVILDESLGALDPTTLSRALRVVLDRDAAVLVVAQ